METYKNIEGYDNYEISDLGNVRNKTTGKIIKSRIDSKGYYVIDLRSCPNVKKTFSLHRLLATAFIENLEGKPVVDHIDRNPLNNKLDNLRWATVSENGMNKKTQRNNTSTCTGVRFKKDKQMWCTEIKLQGKSKFIGHYVNLDDAVNARKEAETKYFGEFQAIK